VDRVSKDVVTGMTEEAAEQTMRNDKPMLVYVYDCDDEEARDAIEQERAFTTEKVAIGARFFDRLRIDSESAAQDRLLADRIRRLPVIVFVRPNYEVASVMRPKFSATRVFRSLCATMKKDYKNCVNTVLKKQKDIMKDRVALDRDRTKLVRLNEQIADEESARKREALVTERDELEKTVTGLQAKLDEREDALYKLEEKEPKT
jgi:hypothetical protein